MEQPIGLLRPSGLEVRFCLCGVAKMSEENKLDKKKEDKESGVDDTYRLAVLKKFQRIVREIGGK